MFVTVAAFLLLLLNVLIALLFYKKISKRLDLLESNEKEKSNQANEKDIHTILSSRLLDIQNRKYSVQQKFRD